MAKPISSHASSTMLKWCREHAAVTQAQAAAAVKKGEEIISSWEAGTSSPSISDLRKLAKKYHRPLMVFYLASPPTEFTLVKDLRTLPSGADRSFSQRLRFAMRICQERQAWAINVAIDRGYRANAIVGSTKKSADPHAVARRLRKKLGVTFEAQRSCTSSSAAYGMWRQACEALGVLTLQTTGIDIEEMRGFALPDHLVPVIVTNGNDTYSAKIFTLIHELAHVLLGVSAISGAPSQIERLSPSPSIEKFCNKIAEEVLVPRATLREQVPPNWESHEEDTIRRLAAMFHVSRSVILYRLVDAGLATKDLIRRWITRLNAPVFAKKGGAVPRSKVVLSRTGTAFARLVVESFYSGEIHGGELSRLLGMGMKHLPALESRLYPKRIRSA